MISPVSSIIALWTSSLYSPVGLSSSAKSGVKESDIRPYIYEFSAEVADKDKMILTLCVAAGNEYNLKVDTVIDAMQKYTQGFCVEFFASHRKAILAGDNELI